MAIVSDEELIKIARSVVSPKRLSETCEVGGVGCALVTDKGSIYTGVCIDTACSMGFCAEHNAIGQMITKGEANIIKIVAVDWDGSVLPPCGRCREFIYQVTNYNRDVVVIISDNETKKLEELLPYAWCGKK